MVPPLFHLRSFSPSQIKIHYALLQIKQNKYITARLFDLGIYLCLHLLLFSVDKPLSSSSHCTNYELQRMRFPLKLFLRDNLAASHIHCALQFQKRKEKLTCCTKATVGARNTQIFRCGFLIKCLSSYMSRTAMCVFPQPVSKYTITFSSKALLHRSN